MNVGVPKTEHRGGESAIGARRSGMVQNPVIVSDCVFVNGRFDESPWMQGVGTVDAALRAQSLRRVRAQSGQPSNDVSSSCQQGWLTEALRSDEVLIGAIFVSLLTCRT